MSAGSKTSGPEHLTQDPRSSERDLNIPSVTSRIPMRRSLSASTVPSPAVLAAESPLARSARAQPIPGREGPARAAAAAEAPTPSPPRWPGLAKPGRESRAEREPEPTRTESSGSRQGLTLEPSQRLGVELNKTCSAPLHAKLVKRQSHPASQELCFESGVSRSGYRGALGGSRCTSEGSKRPRRSAAEKILQVPPPTVLNSSQMHLRSQTTKPS